MAQYLASGIERDPIIHEEGRILVPQVVDADVIKKGGIAVLNDEYGLSVDQVEVLYDSIAGLMYRAVRIGGVPCSGLPWRWGYGWPACE